MRHHSEEEGRALRKHSDACQQVPAAAGDTKKHIRLFGSQGVGHRAGAIKK